MNEHKLWKIIYSAHNIISDLMHEKAELKERNKVLEDACEILREQNERMYEQIFSEEREMHTYTVKSFKNERWTTLGLVSATCKEDAWMLAIEEWGNLVTHVTDFDE